MVLVLIPLAYAMDECAPSVTLGDIPCQITSNWNYTAPCSQWNATVYNLTGDNVVNYTFASYGISGLCYTNWTYTTLGSYTGVVNNGDTFNISIVGDKKMIGFGVLIFMIMFTLGFFIIPFAVRSFTNNAPTDYILKHLIFAGGILFLWLDVTILRTMAINAGVGVDDLLQGVWWFTTLLVVIIITTMVFTTTIGLMNMLKEANMRKRMGEE